MCEEFFFHSPYADMPIDTDCVEETIERFFAQPKEDAMVLLALDDSDNPIGMIAAQAVEFPFNTQRISTEIIWWMDPEFRSTKRALGLIEMYEFWAQHIAKCNAVQMVCLSNLDPDRLGKYYERRGYKQVERVYMKGIN